MRRRSFLAAVLAAATFRLPQADAQSPASTKRPALLQAPRDIDVLATRTRVVLQLNGTLQVADPDPASKKPPRQAEIKAESTVDYDERAHMDGLHVASAARHYHEATVQSWIAGNASSHTLRNDLADTRLARVEGAWQQYSPTGPLLAREIDLLRLPINSAVIDQLLPAAPVKADDRWTPTEATLAEVFQLDAAHSSTVSCQVTKVEAGVATIECSGDIEGTVHNVPTKLKINANLQASLGSQCAMVTWVGMSLTENREISQAEPGFNLTARVKLIRKEEPDACRDVSLSELKNVAASQDDGRWLHRIASVAGRYQMLADRRWKTIVDTGEESILRLIENNQVIAQCNITRLPKLVAGQQLTLAGMQDDIKRSLEQNLDSLVESSERANSGGARVLRVVAVGKSSDVPVRWVYVHISDDTGRRVSLVFTMSGEAAEAFGLADEQMTSSFELLPDSAAGTPTPAASAADSAARPSATKTR